jgi:hypothetical protein
MARRKASDFVEGRVKGGSLGLGHFEIVRCWAFKEEIFQAWIPKIRISTKRGTNRGAGLAILNRVGAPAWAGESGSLSAKSLFCFPLSLRVETKRIIRFFFIHRSMERPERIQLRGLADRHARAIKAKGAYGDKLTINSTTAFASVQNRTYLRIRTSIAHDHVRLGATRA